MSRKRTSCFLKIAKIFVFAKTPTPGCGVTKVLRIYIVGGKRTSYELSPPKWYKEKGLFCRETNIGGSDRSGQREKPPRQTPPGEGSRFAEESHRRVWAEAVRKRSRTGGERRSGERVCRGSVLPVLGEIGKIFVSARTPAPGRGRRQFYESTSWGKNKGCTNLAHPG